jgi:hypothetical protein
MEINVSHFDPITYPVNGPHWHLFSVHVLRILIWSGQKETLCKKTSPLHNLYFPNVPHPEAAFSGARIRSKSCPCPENEDSDRIRRATVFSCPNLFVPWVLGIYQDMKTFVPWYLGHASAYNDVRNNLCKNDRTFWWRLPYFDVLDLVHYCNFSLRTWSPGPYNDIFETPGIR